MTAMLFLLGLLAWSLAEYLVHRFALHGCASVGHLDGHHARPGDYAIGPSWVVVIATMLPITIAAGALVGVPFAAGILAGLLFYLVVHRLCHHGHCPRGLRWLARHHDVHHARGHVNFGVSSPLWDLALGSYAAPDDTLQPFTTDGCSGGMTWAWQIVKRRDPPWNGCCVEHDKAYWQGGTKADRRWADAGLLIAVAQNGHPLIAILMWLAVRVGGHPLLPLPWRWGYGWKFPRGYTRKTD